MRAEVQGIMIERYKKIEKINKFIFSIFLYLSIIIP